MEGAVRVAGQPSDEEIVRRVVGGERDAYRILVDRYGPMVFSVVRRFCTDPTETEDLAQEIFVKTYQGLQRYRGQARFSSWLYAIAQNHGRDHVKRSRPVGEISHAEETATEPPAQGSLTPHEALERAEQVRHLRSALDQLAPDYAVPFLLKYEADLSYEEMAHMLDTTAGALKVRVHRARAKLRALLEDRI
ncbi:MAG TPA: RNA polymerase sigma factor [Gemmatimonadota bacterium]|nr:RNA polymerase sigma factor [Gemmatimonadota bacterium]